MPRRGVCPSNKVLSLVGLLCLLATMSCGGGGGQIVAGPPPTTPSPDLTAADVQAVIAAAVTSTNVPMVVAVSDRGGNLLGLYRKLNAPAQGLGNFSQMVDARELSLALARTASYFSNDQAPLSSRTVRFISGIHFPPGITNTANAALYGIENTNRGCPLNVTFAPGKNINPSRTINGASTGFGIITGKADINDSNPTAVNPGGVPLFKNGRLVGGVGVVADDLNVAEFAAFTGAVGAGFGPTPAPPGVVVIDGISLPFVLNTSRPAGYTAGTADGAYDVAAIPSPGPPPEDYLVTPTNGPLGGLTAAEVQSIVDKAISTANITRAVIRLPIGQRAKFAIAVADLDGRILALNRMPDATVFSIDVAVAKARNLVYFSSQSVDPQNLPGVPAGTAVTNRTISFGAQPLFPPGIDGSGPGPFFPLYQYDTANPCTNGHQPANPNQNGIVFFPGSVPLYKNGVLVGALGISGDGVEQDDYDSAQAYVGFEPPANIMADQVLINGVRLPYLKFPRNPTF
jgi:uncharacterized protein GlcG (DUF336 family)